MDEGQRWCVDKAELEVRVCVCVGGGGRLLQLQLSGLFRWLVRCRRSVNSTWAGLKNTYI